MTVLITKDIGEFIDRLHRGKRLLGLDVGSVRLGVALSDRSWQIARAHATVQVTMFDYLVNLIKSEDVTGIIVGWPLTMRNEESASCVLIRKFIDQVLIPHCPLPIFLEDERLSSKAVYKTSKASGRTRKQAQSAKDELAAAYIMQGVLDKMHRYS
jgi:putative Holliday junction resolvase